MSNSAEGAQGAASAPAATRMQDVFDAVIKNTQQDVRNIIDKNKIGLDEDQHEQSKQEILTLIKQIMDGHLRISGDTVSQVQARIGEIDKAIQLQVNQIIHAPQFQQLEGTWRGIEFLAKNTIVSPRLKIRLLNVSKQELASDLGRATKYDRSVLWKKVYEESFGQLGGEPFSVLVGDYEFSRSNADVDLLTRVSKVAASAHTPFISAASASLLGLESYSKLGTEFKSPDDIAKRFDNPLYIKWNHFRSSEDSRYVALTMPRVLIRQPYAPDSPNAVSAFTFVEDVSGPDQSKFLWSNAAYAFAQRVTSSYFRKGWGVDIRGVDGGGGEVAGLPIHTFKTDDGEIDVACPTETLIPDRYEAQLSEAGFLPLIYHQNSDRAYFIGAQSCQKPKTYRGDSAATASAALSARIPYLMAVSRFAHYLKAIVRDKVGTFAMRADCEQDLNRWISLYKSSDSASAEEKLRKPLRSASVTVLEEEGRPGYYRTILQLEPHLQLESMNISLRLVTEVKKAG